MHIPLVFGILHSERLAKLQHSCQPDLGGDAAMQPFVIAWERKMINRPRPLLWLERACTATNCGPAQDHGTRVQRTLFSHSGRTLLLTN